MKQVTGFGDF